ncbi:transcriptional regulator [Candidatus Micrarchaeota archaeon]|nr:transcriptional regulator [Candidatus Micrarchaeota archaeon]
MADDLDYCIKKMEIGPLQRFKNQNAVLKKYGEDGLKLYRAADGKKTLEELVESLDLKEKFVIEVAEWLQEKKMVRSTSPPENEEVPSKKKIVDEEEEVQPRKSKLRELIEQETAKKTKVKEDREKEKPVEIETEEEASEKELEPEEPSAEEEESKAEQEEEKPAEERESVSEQDEEIQPDMEIEDYSEEKEKTGKGLNPVEKTIKEKYGEAGLKVYALIDGQKTAEEIMREVGISEAKLIEMLEFMEKQGIIKLEHPETKAAVEAKEESGEFNPLAEESTTGTVRDSAPVELITKSKIDFFSGVKLKAKIALKYGEKGSRMFDAINGTVTDIDISANLGINLVDVRSFISFLASNNAVKIRPLDRSEVTKRYGEECFTIYKRYGREGVLLYELVGKDLGIKQMANIVTEDKGKFAEMLVFIHKVLGIDIPIDKDVIYSQLENKKR